MATVFPLYNVNDDMLTPRETPPHTRTVRAQPPSGTPRLAQPPPPPQTWGTQSQSAPTPLKRPMRTLKRGAQARGQCLGTWTLVRRMPARSGSPKLARGTFDHWTTISADIGPVVVGPSWLSTKQESSPERLTGCSHPNCPPRTTRASSAPHGIRTLDLLTARRDLCPLLPSPSSPPG